MPLRAPPRWKTEERAEWDAWVSSEGVTKTEAMRIFTGAVDELYRRKKEAGEGKVPSPPTPTASAATATAAAVAAAAAVAEYDKFNSKMTFNLDPHVKDGPGISERRATGSGVGGGGGSGGGGGVGSRGGGGDGGEEEERRESWVRTVRDKALFSTPLFPGQSEVGDGGGGSGGGAIGASPRCSPSRADALKARLDRVTGSPASGSGGSGGGGVGSGAGSGAGAGAGGSGGGSRSDVWEGDCGRGTVSDAGSVGVAGEGATSAAAAATAEAAAVALDVLPATAPPPSTQASAATAAATAALAALAAEAATATPATPARPTQTQVAAAAATTTQPQTQTQPLPQTASAAVAAAAAAAPAKAGVLYKKREVFPGWRPRTFMLDRGKRLLRYYLPSSARPRGNIPLEGCAVDLVASAGQKGGEGEHV
eukprot:jgi/Undpi1/7630/HiC_scaffold_23.g10103.m1